MRYTILIFLLSVSFATYSQSGRTMKLSSPDSRIQVQVELREKLFYSITHGDDVILTPSAIGMSLSDGTTFGQNPSLRKSKENKVNRNIDAYLYKRNKIRDEVNEVVLTFKGDYQVIFRAYNSGVAYRFVSTRKADFLVRDEEAAFVFAEDHKAWVPYVNKDPGASIEEQLWNSFENTYSHGPLSEMDAKRLAFLPVLVDVSNGKKVCITEADLEDYPGMYLINQSGKNSLTGYFPAYPRKTETGGHNQLQQIVKEREPYIARATGSRNFPWRVLIISSDDRELADSDLVYQLASPSRIDDVSWIKPGKVAWDWWND